MTLDKLQPNKSAVVTRLLAHGAMRRRFLDLGLVEGTRVVCLGRSPMGDPAAYSIRGAVIAVRDADSRDIEVVTEEIS